LLAEQAEVEPHEYEPLIRHYLETDRDWYQQRGYAPRWLIQDYEEHLDAVREERRQTERRERERIESLPPSERLTDAQRQLVDEVCDAHDIGPERDGAYRLALDEVGHPRPEVRRHLVSWCESRIDAATDHLRASMPELAEFLQPFARDGEYERHLMQATAEELDDGDLVITAHTLGAQLVYDRDYRTLIEKRFDAAVHIECSVVNLDERRAG
jgi:hypothetical protein